MASHLLFYMGFDVDATKEQAKKFIKLDVEGLKRLAAAPKNEKEYIFMAREEIAQQEKLMIEDLKIGSSALKNYKVSKP